ncbi:MAG TPA: CopG family transcriptional regulator [Thermoanaerobaculia bacterium]|nr:CopG family transcriptional regulator [Thermoanaerobaculia bacterium]
MVKTTLYLPEELKAALERLAEERRVSEAALVREALEEMVERSARPRPQLPLLPEGLGDPSVASRVDDLLEGFGH